MGTNTVVGRLSRFRRPIIALLVFGTMVLIGAVLSQLRSKPMVQLEPFIGKDLRTITKREQVRFDNLISKLLPKARTFVYPKAPQSWNPRNWWNYWTAEPFSFAFSESWYLWNVLDDKGNGRLILFQGSHLFMIPGQSSAHIFVMDRTGAMLTETQFSTGWRIDLEDAHWLEDSVHGFPCLLICSSPSINGADITSQYYAFLDDTFPLVRLEDSTGQFERVNYHNPNHTIGPHPPKRTAVEWELALHSSNPAEILRTLVWLGGTHSDPPIRDAEHICVEKFEDAALALQVRARPSVRARIAELTRFEDMWVREAAEEAWIVVGGRER